MMNVYKKLKNKNFLTLSATLWRNSCASARLMVGIKDYQVYLQHMQQQHPKQTPLTRDQFYQYCLEARFPKDGKVNKCPC